MAEHIKIFEEISVADLSGYIADGWHVVGYDKFKVIDQEIDGVMIIDGQALVVGSVEIEQPIRTIGEGAEHLTDGEASLFVVPHATAGDLLTIVLLSGLFLGLILTWLFRILFRQKIDFKNR